MDHSRPSDSARAAMQSLAAGDLPPIVRAFFERLRRIPLGVWADVATARDGASDDQSARARLRRIVENTPGIVTRVRRRVVELSVVAEGFVHPAIIARMKKAALAAALALAAREALGEEDFARLYAPFAGIIPLAELTAPWPDRGAWRDRDLTADGARA